jgi:hypothetical protein
MDKNEAFKEFLNKFKDEETEGLIESLSDGFEVLFEAEEWAQKAHAKKGKMHELLGVPEDEKITDHFKNGKSLAEKLLNALNGDKKKASSMLAFAANADASNNVLDAALHHIKKMED